MIDIAKQIERKFTYETNIAWGDLEHIVSEIENKEQQFFNINVNGELQKSIIDLHKKIAKNYYQYDFDIDLQHFKSTRNIRINDKKYYHIGEHPHMLNNT